MFVGEFDVMFVGEFDVMVVVVTVVSSCLV